MSVASQITAEATLAFKYKLAFAVCGAAAIALSLYVAPGIAGLCGALLALLMTAIAFHDAQDLIIPDRYSGAGLVLGLVAACFLAEQDAVWAFAVALLRAAALALAFLTIRWGYRRLRGRHGLGLGDVKLAGVAGAWLDWTTLPIALEIAVLGALSAVVAHQLITRRRLKPTTRLPFGLFLAPSIWIGWLIQTGLPWPGP